ncbi:Lrp/AsnC family transcriptional regulator [Candidatus Woesearchaeota archaeon]|nr:Lrp/AsnC family transcriptional regulator [Candidatus Woesearchaeota archaeon]
MKGYGLDLTDRKLLYELDLNSRASYKELATKLRIAKETVRFRVTRLVQKRYIKNFITTMNTSFLNQFYYKLFYKFYRTSPAIDQKIVSYIQNHKSVAYFASTEGRYDLLFLILSKDMGDLYRFLVPFREEFGEYILEQQILTMPSVHRFNFRFFHETGKLLHTEYPLELKEPDIDGLDYAIIEALAKNARMSLLDLAKLTDSETNVIKYRIRKLKEKKILGSHVLDINFDAFGVEQFQVDFSLKNHSIIEKIINYAAQNPKATFATVTLGKYDLALEFAVHNIKELRGILNDIKEKFSDSITDHDVFILYEHSINWFPSGRGKLEN